MGVTTPGTPHGDIADLNLTQISGSSPNIDVGGNFAGLTCHNQRTISTPQKLQSFCFPRHRRDRSRNNRSLERFASSSLWSPWRQNRLYQLKIVQMVLVRLNKDYYQIIHAYRAEALSTLLSEETLFDTRCCFNSI